MKVTQEADYAIRICCVLDEAGGVLDAVSIAESVVITKSIALKVLRKLKVGGMVTSQQGADGGYSLSVDANDLTIHSIISAIDGNITISKCLSDTHACSKNGYDKTCCKMHLAFDAVNQAIIDRLKLITVRDITSNEVSSLDIVKKLK